MEIADSSKMVVPTYLSNYTSHMTVTIINYMLKEP
jgi:hypothetical protein